MDADIIIIGAGPAGLSAASYASRAGRKVILIDPMGPGGQLLFIDEIENYPALEPMSGYELSAKLEKQVESFGVATEYTGALSVRKDGDKFTVETDSGHIESRSVIIATGAVRKKLGCAGEEEYSGKGVSYCATCDGPFFKGKKVAVVGGGNTALTDSLYLSKLCSEVHIIHRRNEFRAEKILVDRIRENKRIFIHPSVNVMSINGDGNCVTSVTLDDESVLNVSAVFIFVGTVPNSSIVEALGVTNDGFIMTDERMETGIPGLFAAGDVRNTPFRQVVTAASDGATAAHYADEYLSR